MCVVCDVMVGSEKQQQSKQTTANNHDRRGICISKAMVGPEQT
jgi:hypothetical protein